MDTDFRKWRGWTIQKPRITRISFLRFVALNYKCRSPLPLPGGEGAGEGAVAKWNNLMALHDRTLQHKRDGKVCGNLRDLEEVVTTLLVSHSWH